MSDEEARFEKLTALTDEQFKEHVRTHNKLTLDTLSGESETPHLGVVTRDMETLKDGLVLFCLAVPFNEDEEKRPLMVNLGKKFYEEQQVVLAVVLSCECWLSKKLKDGDWPRVQPRHDPHKQEAIMVAGAGLNPNQRFIITTPIRRDEKNNIVIDGQSEEMEGGRFALLDCFWRGYFEKPLAKMKEAEK